MKIYTYKRLEISKAKYLNFILCCRQKTGVELASSLLWLMICKDDWNNSSQIFPFCLHLDLPCNLNWIVKHGKNVIMWLWNLELKGACSFLSFHLKILHPWSEEAKLDSLRKRGHLEKGAYPTARTNSQAYQWGCGGLSRLLCLLFLMWLLWWTSHWLTYMLAMWAADDFSLWFTSLWIKQPPPKELGSSSLICSQTWSG